MTDPQIDFQNVESPTLQQQVKDLIDDLVQLLPSDAAVRVNFRHLHDRFLAEIKVASESVYMHAADSAAAIGDVLEDVRAKLMSQIVDWRNHRFAS